MPYIKMSRREAIDAGAAPENCGELNYAVTVACIRHGHKSMSELRALILCYLSSYVLREKLSYQRINDILGALDGARRELARRCKRDTVATGILLQDIATDFYGLYAAPYEDEKIKTNGDINYAAS